MFKYKSEFKKKVNEKHINAPLCYGRKIEYIPPTEILKSIKELGVLK